MRHTGLPGKGSATAVCFTYHKNALGHGSGADVTSDITWHGDRAAPFVNNMMSQGACLIDPEGVIETRVDDTATIPAYGGTSMASHAKSLPHIAPGSGQHGTATT